eukprot:scaffold37720_cov67-Phaeocystis_antarctica.AAC.5
MEPLAAEPAMVAMPSELQHSTCAACARWCVLCTACAQHVHSMCTHLQVGGERGVRAAVARHDSVEHHVGHLNTCGCSLDTGVAASSTEGCSSTGRACRQAPPC